MKIAVTGHTSGIGEAIFRRLIPNHTMIGLSRSHGYNILDTALILSTIKNCDVFINNAYDGLGQVSLLEQLYDIWKEQEKTIVNIGSTVTSFPPIDPNINKETWAYYHHKKDLETLHRNLSWQRNKCRLILISPGPTDTQMILRHDINYKMSPDSVAESVMIALTNNFIQELTVFK
jgi:NAD(P)-dependent dehydrogenase (short-subunit alcohol dehydrogenase family)